MASAPEAAPAVEAAPAPRAEAAGEAIAVYARLKPVKSEDTRGQVNVPKRFGKQKSCQVTLRGQGVGGGVQERQLEFSLDWIFTEEDSQEDVYNIAAHDRVSSVLNGYNATILAYGQTGSGKTHTMFGPEEVLSDFLGVDPKLNGIVPRASDHLFEGLRHGNADSTFIVQCSYLEIYNNTLNDLFSGRSNLPMREKPGSGLSVEGLTYQMVSSSREVMAALSAGNENRVVAAMKMNARSSRGHAIFTIYVKEIMISGGERPGKLNLVDLAGMESSKKSYAVEGASNNEMRKLEAKNINTSLYALGSVIEKLSEAGRKGGGASHVPYRDSKLTRLLQDSLGGNSKSTILVALRIEAQNIEESVNTLRFAQRAKAVKMKVTDNTITVKDTSKLLKEVETMSTQLETANVMVRQLQMQLASRAAEEDDRLATLDEAVANGTAGEGGASVDVVKALQEEVAILKRKNTSLLHKSILHRVVKAQSEKAIAALRDAHADAVRQLTESEELLQVRTRENRELHARVEELERMLTNGVGGGIGGLGSGAADGDADDWREDLISSAESELKAAMASGDAERLKAAIANASATVAKARARGSQVLKRQQVLHGDGQAAPTEHVATAADALTDEEKLYVRFHEVATARKLALASRGFEVQNVFIDNLYDLALSESVPAKEWGEFMRIQLPSPRDDEEVDEAWAGADGSGEGAMDYSVQLVDETGAVKKVRKAVHRMARLIGWRAKMTHVECTYRQAEANEHFGMDEPDVVQSEGVPAGPPPANPSGSLHEQVAAASSSSADAHLGLLNAISGSAGGAVDVADAALSERTRAQRYNDRLRERIDAREQGRNP